MEIEEYLKYRKDLLNESKDEEGFISEASFLNSVLPSMLDAKLIESEDYNETYFLYAEGKLKINGYTVNESGERLQLFLINEDSINLNIADNDLNISLKSYYDTQFNRAIKFIQSSLKGELTNELQDADGITVLTTQISSSEGLDQFDVLEVFLISATATVDNRGVKPQPKRIEFDNEKLRVTFTKNREKITKEIVVIKKLIDLNFLYSVLISQGNRDPLTVDFEKLFNFKIEAIKAADEEYFESYLCVLPGNIISDLYKEYSTRMLEKNVRSFLQFPKKGVNSGMKNTIIDCPEKFIAFNNGLTITSTGKDVSEIKGKFYIKSLTDFQIVNGGQTTATIYFSQKEGISVDKIKVMAKINVAKKSTEEELDKLITDISTFSNAQTRVSKVDLRARSVQLVKIKALSESIITPKGVKWFFERAKGELNTAIRKLGNKERMLKKYPKDRRFTKEDLAKYYTAWGDKPYLVKLGGEKVFREFIEELTGEGPKRKAPVVNRAFYENLISRIILFRSLEKIYGNGINKIGNLRAAVIPYSISILYNCADGGSDDLIFDMNKIWIKEELEDDLSGFFYDLMKLMNNLIKRYATSDDLSENSKRPELWKSISESKEMISFMASKDSLKIIKKYTVSREENKKRQLKLAKINEVNFKLIQDNISIHANGTALYKKLQAVFQKFTHHEKEHLEFIIQSVFKHEDINEQYVDYEKSILNKIIIESPGILDNISATTVNYLFETLDYIIEQYNNAVNNQDDVKKYFDKIQLNAKNKNLKNHQIWGNIGEALFKGEAPKIKDIIAASSLFSDETAVAEKQKQIIDESLLIKMIEWDSKKKILSINEIKYLTEFAYGFKKLNAFHENIVKRHLQSLINAGFVIGDNQK